MLNENFIPVCLSAKCHRHPFSKQKVGHYWNENRRKIVEQFPAKNMQTEHNHPKRVMIQWINKRKCKPFPARFFIGRDIAVRQVSQGSPWRGM